MKKIASLCLALLLMAQLLIVPGISTSAANANTLVETASTNPEQSILAGYAVTPAPAEAQAVGTAQEFSSMSADGTYYLTADLTLTSTYSKEFKGKLYGCGHTLTLSKTGTWSSIKPVFGTLNGAEIYDLTLEGQDLSMSADYVGALAQNANGATIYGVTNKVNVKNSKNGKFGGGIVGYAANTTLKYCTNEGAITGHSSSTRLGGLVGIVNEENATLTLENCINYGAVTGANQTGGLVSVVESGKSVTFKNCANYGTITVSVSDGGGIIGKVTSAATKVTFENCYNSARIVGATYTGGLVGPLSASELTVKNCHNGCFVKGCTCKGTDHGKITNFSGNHVIGGLIGYFWCETGVVTITNCSNAGDLISGGSSSSVTEGGRVGGIASVMEAYKVVVDNCHNSGYIESLYYVGGLFARIGCAGESYQDASGNTAYKGETLQIENCSNSGKLISSTYSGGIVGFQQYASKLIFKNCTNNGEIESTGNIGGILARIGGDHTLCTSVLFEDCHNTADLTTTATMGGIVGYFAGVYDIVNHVTFKNCTNKGDLTSSNFAGGISGITDVKNYDAMNCRNDGDIEIVNQANETAMAGGIAARTYGAATFTECVNTGNIVSKKTHASGDTSYYMLYVGGIAGYSGRNGSDYKDDVSVFEKCLSAGILVSRNALDSNQAIVTGGIVGKSSSICFATRCMVVGEINATCMAAGISGDTAANGVSGSEFSTCVVAADIYNSGDKVTSRSQGTAGIACYVWGAAHVTDCVVMGDLELGVTGSDLAVDQRRPLSALVGYSNNGGGIYQNNFFAGKLIAGEGTNCIVVMVAFTVAADVTGDVGYDIDGNYSYYQYPLFYWGNTNNGVLSGGVYSEYMTPTLTEEQIAEGISFADMMVEGNPTMEILRTCTGIEVPILTFMRNDYTWMLEHVGGHVYVENCEPYCTVCRKEKVEIHHLYDSECDTRCNYCSATRVVDDHDYGAWVTVKPATETETGLRKSNCRICGHEETTVIPMLNTAGGNDAADGADSENQGNNNVTEPEQDNTMLVIYISVGAAVLLVVVVVILIIAKGSKKKAKAEKQEP